MKTQKEAFIELMNYYFNEVGMDFEDGVSLSIKDFTLQDWENALRYSASIEKEKNTNISELGQTIIKWMLSNKDTYSNIFTSKDIAEGIFSSARSVSGAMRKLISLNLVIKVGDKPVQYALSSEGLTHTC